MYKYRPVTIECGILVRYAQSWLLFVFTSLIVDSRVCSRVDLS